MNTMPEIATLTERVTHLAERIGELSGRQDQVGEEFKIYRHAIRDELQKILIDISQISYDRAARGLEMDRLKLMVDGVVKRLEALEKVKAEAAGGFRVVHYLWGGVVMLLLIVADVAIRKMIG